MTMYWQEEKENLEFVVPDNVVDLVFSIDCKRLPVDHAYALFSAVQQILPWFGADDEQTGLHVIHVADSGNGWERPSGADDVLYLSRRTKLTLRLPLNQVENARTLSGSLLDVAGYPMRVGDAKVTLLSTNPTLYARYVAAPEEQDEEQFIADVARQLRDMDVHFKKILAGKQNCLQTPEGLLFTRSLMVADLQPEDAVKLQERGIGPHRGMGCGVFIPHKSIKKVTK